MKTWGYLDSKSKENYVNWHDYAYKDDLKVTELLRETSPRNAIVHGYYAMLNCARKYLARVHNIRIGGNTIHDDVINALREKISDKSTREELMHLIENAKAEYVGLESIKPEDMPVMLKYARDERSKQSYYLLKDNNKKPTGQNEVERFLQDIVNPFIKVIEELNL